MKDQYDCIVIGGGPAGSTVAALVAEAGCSTLLLEREKMPRFHVGESLMPETYWIFQRLGVLDKMKNSKFVKKFSVQFVSHTGKESQPFFFQEHDPRESSQTWQVERASFDKMLFDNAGEKGADCYDDSRVLDVLFEGGRAVGVRVQSAGGEPREIHAQVVVDATGQQALLLNRLGLREGDPDLRKAAIWTYYKNARRDPGDNGGATIVLHTQSKESWFWYIPLSDDITSIGVVADNDYLLKGRGKPEEVYEDELVKCPALVDRLMNAEMVGQFRVAKEFTYSSRQSAGDGWVLVGDAFSFIDPLYSSGVFFALKMGELVADCIVEGLQNGDTSAAQLGKWSDEFVQGAKWVRQLVYAYYTHEFSFGAFLREHPQHRGVLTDILIGRIFNPQVGRVFDDLIPAIEKAKQEAARSRGE